MTEHKKHLYNMNELSDYKISDGYPDIRGWDVKDFNNRVVGKVESLMVNIDAQRVVYLDVEVDKTIIDANHDPYGRPTHLEVREFVNKDGENHIIIPIGLVDLNTDSKFVYTDILDHQTFSETKRYRKGDSIERSYENQVLDSYARSSRSTDHDNDSALVTDRSSNKDLPSEARIREIVREEIRAYHNTNDQRSFEQKRYNNDVNDDVIITDDALDLDRRRRNEDDYDNDDFYERREFNDERFGKKRTPGL